MFTSEPTVLAKLPTIGRDERASFVGPSGSGKTTLMRALLGARANVIILDTKRGLEMADWQTIATEVKERDLYNVRGGRFVFTVPKHWFADPRYFAQFFDWAIRGAGRTIAVDEGANVPDTLEMKLLALQGRAAKVPLWYGTQRPHGIPLYTISDCSYLFVFMLKLDRDQKRVEEGAAQPIPWDSLKQKHSFVSVSDGDVSEPLILPEP